jgi:hypothetical protein
MTVVRRIPSNRFADRIDRGGAGAKMFKYTSPHGRPFSNARVPATNVYRSNYSNLFRCERETGVSVHRQLLLLLFDVFIRVRSCFTTKR